MVRYGVVILGVIVLVGTYYVLNIYITPQQKQQLALAQVACNANIGGIPLGQIGQMVSSEAAQACSQAATLSQILSVGPIGYLVGAGLVILGLVIGNGKKRKKVVYEEEEEEPEEEEAEVEEEPEETEQIVKVRCKKCKTLNEEEAKFCKKCGKKL